MGGESANISDIAMGMKGSSGLSDVGQAARIFLFETYDFITLKINKTTIFIGWN